MKTIELSQGRFALVDDKDFHWLNQWEWSAIRGRNTFYAIRRVRPSTAGTLMHRLIVGGGADGALVDHQDGDGLNNQRANLRLSTNQQNVWNQGLRRNNTTGYKGVSKRGSRYRAYVVVDGTQQHLGTFTTAEEAALAYNKAAAALFGVYARLNELGGCNEF